MGIKNSTDFESGKKNCQKVLTKILIDTEVNEFCGLLSFSTMGKSFRPLNFFPTCSTDSKSASNSAIFIPFLKFVFVFVFTN